MILYLLTASLALADTRLSIVFDHPDSVSGSVAWSGSVHSSADVPDQARTFDSRDYALQIRVPVSHTKQSAIMPKLTFGLRDQVSGAELGDSAIPRLLTDLSVGMDTVSAISGGGVFGTSFSVGVESDRFMPSLDTTAAEALVFLRKPSSKTSGWIYFVQFSNNRNYLNWVPVPGIAFQSAIGRSFSFALGAPYASFRFAPLPELRLEGSLQLFHSAKTQIIYSASSGEAFVVGVRWDHEGYLLHGRENAAERLIVEEKRAYGGFEAQITPEFRLQLVAGMLFEKKLALRKSMFEQPATRVALDPALFGMLNLYLTF